MSFLEAIYDKVPIPLQNIMVSGKGILNNFSRYGKTYQQYRIFYSDYDTWPIDKKIEYQNKEFVRLVQHAFNNSPFYKNLYSGIDMNTIKHLDDIKRLPIVDKELLRNNINDVYTIEKRGAVEGHTGGTTGKSLVVLYTKDDMKKRMAMLDNFKSRVGFEHRKMKRADFGGKHIIPPNQKKKVFWRYNFACKQMLFSSFHLTEENLPYIVDELNRFKPDVLDGFFTSMCDVANFIERHKVQLEFQPIAIFPTSETLSDLGRALLERVFNCKVYDQYASSEGAPFFTECIHQKKHMELASGVFEKYEKASDEVLVTSFTTYGTPLIRYRIGDTMRWEEKPVQCSCGIESVIVDSIEGRALDFLFTADGARINGGNVANLFKNMPNSIIRAQLIQEKMDYITVLLEVDKTIYKTEYDQLLQKEFSHKFGTKTKLVIQHVEEIPREKSGKLRMIINKVC